MAELGRERSGRRNLLDASGKLNTLQVGSPYVSRRSWLPWLTVGALFVAIRVLLLTFVPPLFDSDTYKYLGGADALQQGGGLPPLFHSLPVTGGVLHAVPGYVWLIDGLWWLAGEPSLLVVGIAHALVCGVGFFLAGRIAARCAGETAGVLVFAVLSLAPSLAWLERLVMPDALAAPLILAAAAVALALPPRPDRVLPLILGAAVAGLLMSCCLLMRTSSQVFLAIPLLMSIHAGRGRAAQLAWALVYGIAVLVPLLPWMLHNHELHGEFRLTASTGRNLYFSALWSNTIDRDQRAHQLWPGAEQGSASIIRSFEISDVTFSRLLAAGRSVPEADAEMGSMALRAYAQQDIATLARQRGSILLGLFVNIPEVSSQSVNLADMTPENAFEPAYQPYKRAWAEQRFRHSFSPPVVEEMARATNKSEFSASFFSSWIKLLTFDGPSLLAAYLLSVPLLFGLGRQRWVAIWAFAAPPLVYGGVFAIVGAPLYRYQAGLHPFMLASVVLGATVVVRWMSSRSLNFFRRSKTFGIS